MIEHLLLKEFKGWIKTLEDSGKDLDQFKRGIVAAYSSVSVALELERLNECVEAYRLNENL